MLVKLKHLHSIQLQQNRITKMLRECRKCGELKPHAYFVKNKSCKYGITHTCLVCSAVKQRTVYAKRYKEKDIERSMARNSKGKAKVLEYLGGEYKCFDCGYTHVSSSPFDFHHIEPTIKDKEVAGMYRYSWKRLREEVDKCILLCACCHRLRHDRV